MDDKNKKDNKITKNVYVLGFTSLLNDASKTLLNLILPFYLEFIGASIFIIGFVVGLSASIGSIANAVTGYLSDRTKKTKFYATFGYGLLTISRFLLFFAHTWSFVLVLRFVNDIGEGIKDSPRDVILTNSVSKEVKGKAYGIHRTLHTIGAIIGTLIAVYLLFGAASPSAISRNTYNAIFIVASVLSLIGFLIIYLFLEEKKKVLAHVIAKKTGPHFINRKFKIFILTAGLFAIGNFSVWFMLLKTAEALNTSTNIFGSSDIALSYLLFPVIFAIFATPIGTLSDKISRKKVISFGYALFGIICIGFTLTDYLPGYIKIPVIMGLFALYGIFWATTHAMQRAFTTDLVGEENKGTALGVYHSVVGVIVLPSNLIAGALWAIYGSNATFYFSALIAFLSALLLIFLLKEK